MHSEYNLLFGYATDLNLYQFYSMVFNQILPFGMVFWIIGFVLFAIVQMKTDNMAYAGALMSLYMIVITELGLMTNIYSAMAMRYTGLIVAVVVGYYLYKTIKG